MRMVLTAGTLALALMLAVIGAVSSHAAASRTHASVTPITVDGE